MLFYVFSADELRQLFGRLGYSLPLDTMPRAIASDDERTSHGSTLCGVVHAWVLARSNRARAIRYFPEEAARRRGRHPGRHDAGRYSSG
jgi:trehalose 6-phosphate phosphatase